MFALITGATGMVGRRLLADLGSAAVLSRRPEGVELPGARTFGWEPSQPPPAEAIEGVQVVFHLAGEPVASGRWSAAKKRAIRDSRVVASRQLVEGLRRLPERPRVLVSASAVGWYGDRGDTPLDEGSAPGEGFLAEVCAGWEAEVMAAEQLGVRVVCARLGLVLAPEGGALGRMLPLFRRGLGGRLGSGRQWMSWVHVDDVVGMLRFAAQTEGTRGPLNVVAPQPVRNLDFTQALAKAVRRPALLPAPQLGLKLALGEMSDMLTSSQRVHPAAAAEHGYAHRWPELPAALADCI